MSPKPERSELRPGTVTAKRPRKPRLPFANAWFFPAAALYAALALPWSVLTMLGLVPALPGLLLPAGHAHEMLFGFALAVVSGYLLGPQPLRFTLGLLGCWLLARLGFLFWPGSWPATLAAALFAAGLAWKIIPRFVGAAKKWRNQTIAPVVAGLAMLSAFTGHGFASEVQPLLLQATLTLLATLMFFMGGRIIAPTVAGHALSQSRSLDARVQPRLEGAVLVLLFVTLLAGLWPLGNRFAGWALLVAGVLTGVRLLRWQPQHCIDRPDILVLLLGYAWLALGMGAFGIALATDWLVVSVALHTLTIGALGSLTFGVMTRTRLLYRFRDANARPWIHFLVLLISLAALARVLPPLVGVHTRAWLLIAAAGWSVAFAALAVLLWQTRRTPPRPQRQSVE